MGFRKLTDVELKNLQNQLAAKFKNGPAYGLAVSYLKSCVNRCFGQGDYVIVEPNSSYNDEDYDNSIQYIGVFLANGTEVPPLPGMGKEFRKAWNNDLYIDSRADIGEFIVNLKDFELEDLYVKES